MRMTEPTNKDIMEGIERLEALVKMGLRQRLSDKKEKLAQEIQRRGRMTSGEVEQFFNTSRNWALKMMRDVGKQPGFRIFPGDIAKKIPSTLIYDRALIVQDQNKAIDLLLAERSRISFADVQDELGVDFSRVKQIINEYVTVNPNCRIVDGNKLEKVT
jgi:hypothetical protein